MSKIGDCLSQLWHIHLKACYAAIKIINLRKACLQYNVIEPGEKSLEYRIVLHYVKHVSAWIEKTCIYKTSCCELVSLAGTLLSHLNRFFNDMLHIMVI